MIIIYVWKTGNTKRRDVLPRRAFFQKEDDEYARLNPRSILLSRNIMLSPFPVYVLFHCDTPWLVTEHRKTQNRGRDL